MQAITAALIGTVGPHSSGWLETLRLSPIVERLLVCDVDTGVDSVEGVDAQLGSLDELLSVAGIDMAILSLRNDQYPDAGRRLLERGIPLIIEKPVARTAAEIATLNTISAASDTMWATGFLNRMLPLARELKGLIHDGVLGRVVSVEARMVTSSVQQRNPDSWLFSKQQAGGGILHWLAIHSVDLIRYLTGLEYVDVSGHVATLSDTGIDVEDMAALSFSMDNGAVGSLHAGYVLRERYGDIGITVRGTIGEAIWVQHGFGGADANQQLHVKSQAPGWEGSASKTIQVTPATAVGGYGGEVGIKFVSDFAEAGVRKTGAFITNGADALKAMQFVEAAYAASDSHCHVKVP
jgi:predicted dehydrogenase